MIGKTIRILCVCSDPGGAKAIFSFAEKFTRKGHDVTLISDRYFSFFEDFSVKLKESDITLEHAFEKYLPDLVLTGTSYTSSIEASYIRYAKDLGVKTASFVDHWTSFRERFTFDGTIEYPDEIWVIDEIAVQNALVQGVPKDKLVITGNPYYEFLKYWKPTITKQTFWDKEIMVERNDKKMLLFAPEPLSNVNGITRFGFDEISATQSLIPFFNEIYSEYQLICKPHPNQHIGSLASVLPTQIKILSTDVNINSALYYSDVVLGFFSNILIEAQILGTKVVRFFPDRACLDPLQSQSIGKVCYPDTISNVFKRISDE